MPGMAKPTMFDDMPTKRPHFFFLIPGRKYFALKNCASKFVAIVFRHVARSRSSIERFGKYPALFTTTSTPPKSWLLRDSESQSSSFVTSSSNPSAKGPILFTVSCGNVRSVAITCAPRSASATAIARPMPWAAPVTRATRPSCVLIEVFMGRPSPLAGRLEGGRPPNQVIDHDVGLLVQLGQALLYIPALEMRPQRRDRNMNG